MKHTLFSLLLAATAAAATAQTEVIDISGNNTSSTYVSYDKSVSLPAGKTVEVRMARYCYFSSPVSGSGRLDLYAGGERCYLGTAKGAAWPNWTNFRGDVHVYPYKENAPSAGFYGVVLAHGGKSFSPENIDDAIRQGKVNTSMQTNRVVLHSGATLCCEANSAGAGFRIGELQTEAGSSIIGYMKKNTRAAYFLVGSSGTSATLAGTMAPPDYSDTHPLGLIKEGRGCYRISGNQNYLSAALRVSEGRVLVVNDRGEAEQKKLRGALGARPVATEPVAYVFEKGLLGGTGSIGGTVDNYGTVEPGDYQESGDQVAVTTGTLTLRNYAVPSRQPHLYVRPASVLRFKVMSAADHDRIDVGGDVRFFDQTQDFQQSQAMPVVEVALVGELDGMKAGDELTLLTASGKASQAGDWHFQLRQPARYTWALDERTDGGAFRLVLRLVSLDTPDAPDEPSDPDAPVPSGPTMGPYYDDGIADNTDPHTLRYYAEKSGKRIGVAVSSWKAGMEEGGRQFNMLVAENEMKMDALQPQRGQYAFGSADALADFARRNGMAMRGHCLVWHQQQPSWLSSDGKKNDRGWSRAEALAIMRDHITTVMQHFRGKVTEWDVVNECLDDDQSVIRTNPDGYSLRQNVWQRAIGDDYIDSAFVYAHRADPAATLYLNDYDVEQQGKAKAVAFYNLVKKLRQRGVPIDGVGLQCHFTVGDVDSLKLDHTVSRFGEDGLLCIITELDMGISATTAQLLEEQARHYRVVTDIMLRHDNCPSMVVWGVKDNDSWRSASSPLLYDAGLGRKPAWYAVRSALRHQVVATGVGSVEKREPQRREAIYDLRGRRVVHPLRPGIYVSGGRKWVMTSSSQTPGRSSGRP